MKTSCIGYKLFVTTVVVLLFFSKNAKAQNVYDSAYYYELILVQINEIGKSDSAAEVYDVKFSPIKAYETISLRSPRYYLIEKSDSLVYTRQLKTGFVKGTYRIDKGKNKINIVSNIHDKDCDCLSIHNFKNGDIVLLNISKVEGSQLWFDCAINPKNVDLSRLSEIR